MVSLEEVGYLPGRFLIEVLDRRPIGFAAVGVSLWGDADPGGALDDLLDRCPNLRVLGLVNAPEDLLASLLPRLQALPAIEEIEIWSGAPLSLWLDRFAPTCVQRVLIHELKHGLVARFARDDGGRLSRCTVAFLPPREAFPVRALIRWLSRLAPEQLSSLTIVDRGLSDRFTWRDRPATLPDRGGEKGIRAALTAGNPDRTVIVAR